MRVTILASGSAGNALVVESAGARVLVDAGLTLKVLFAGLTEAFGDVPRFDAVVVTHAHGDHAAHAGRTAVALDAPLWLTQATRRCIRLPAEARTRVFGPRAPFDVGDIEVRPLGVPHDAPQVALVLDDGHARVALVTDLGEVPDGLVDHVAGADVLLAESNHDLDMLRRGPYPESLRRRIASREGHLSNPQCAELLRALGPATRRVVLMHLSEQNNRPELALTHAQEALAGRDVVLSVAPRRGLLQLEVERPAPVLTPAPGRRQLTLPI